MKSRVGGTLVELLTAGALLGLVATACAALLHAQTSIAQTTLRRSAAREAARTALLVLLSDLAYLQPTADVRAVGSDSIAARIFRGLGIVCAGDSSKVDLRYRGLRLPDPDKDSLLYVGAESRSRVRAVGVASTPCTTRIGEQLMSVSSEIELAPGSVVLFYEWGAYSLALNALRYRRGQEGRQPITAEDLDTDASSFAAETDSVSRAVVLTIQARGETEHATREWVRFQGVPR